MVLTIAADEGQQLMDWSGKIIVHAEYDGLVLELGSMVSVVLSPCDAEILRNAIECGLDEYHADRAVEQRVMDLEFKRLVEGDVS